MNTGQRAADAKPKAVKRVEAMQMQISKFRIDGDLGVLVEELIRRDGRSATKVVLSLIREGVESRRERQVTQASVATAIKCLDAEDIAMASVHLQAIRELVTIGPVPNTRGGRNGTAVHRDRSSGAGPQELPKA